MIEAYLRERERGVRLWQMLPIVLDVQRATTKLGFTRLKKQYVGLNDAG